MKKILFFSVCFSSVLLAGPICDFKAKDIQTQIEQAIKHAHKDKLAGLERALKELKNHCDDTEVLKKSQDKIAKLEDKIKQAQTKLVELTSAGKESKIKKMDMKIKALQSELEEEQNELEKMQNLLKTKATQSDS
ncbi:DUF1090 family protein [Helicobacter sp. 11S02596-1]|uniref:DUF1090 family protein n=1 Tax=Helicobacter sp. 11S02596-1 TaxID=1476194 RepID=UPI000BA66845|nr:DUF1090 family protein [Helicobacter sp. 11S02596-1]PAF41621.1 hypothetical protein BJI48_07995 [Helicobacter sp. 11S02596-1]